jgi:hypothetical protein
MEVPYAAGGALLATPGYAIQDNLVSIGDKPRASQASPDTPVATAHFQGGPLT